MPTLVIDCPHCGAGRSSFNVTHVISHPIRGSLWSVIAGCPSCGDLIIAHASATRFLGPGMTPGTIPGNLMEAEDKGVRIGRIWPETVESVTPEHVPPAASKAYEQGARCLSRGDFTPAAAMYRRCLEIALKNFSPDIDAWKLEKRIDKLEASGLITKDLKTWAHRVRLDGNDALHEEEEFTRESATELEEFTRLLLTYLYTLPERIRQRLEKEESEE
ncbi:DUF4145 domain-containing protein [Burkholderia gladioli]|uniref:DUF4145 domain-containing protein n=1 Tax=Burkholderia gladioli TaxID=28095 RepID=UPI001FC8C9CD|nr:DUF4145 domain-containing protein [Burkholderia gladioli]